MSGIVIERETDPFLLRHQQWAGIPLVIGFDVWRDKGERLSCNCGWRTAWRTDPPGTEDMSAWIAWHKTEWTAKRDHLVQVHGYTDDEQAAPRGET